jgi:hypothetical protein
MFSLSIRQMVAMLCAFATLIFAQAALAFQPSSGMWWNENESGKGYNFEFQNDTVFISFFAYDSAGKPKFSTSSGSFNGATKSYTGRLFETEGGSCLGCPKSGTLVTRDVGAISVTWVDSGAATITFPSGLRVPITPFNIGYSRGLLSMEGTWFFGYIIGSTTYAEQYLCRGPLDSGVLLCRSQSGRDAGISTDSRLPGAYILADVNQAGQRVNAFVFYQFADRLSSSYLGTNDVLYPSQGWQTGTPKQTALTGKSAKSATPSVELEELKRQSMKQDVGSPSNPVERDAVELVTKRLQRYIDRNTY